MLLICHTRFKYPRDYPIIFDGIEKTKKTIAKRTGKSTQKIPAHLRYPSNPLAYGISAGQITKKFLLSLIRYCGKQSIMTFLQIGLKSPVFY